MTDDLPRDREHPQPERPRRNRLETRTPPKKVKIRRKAAPRRARVTRAVICCMSCDADALTTKIEGGMCPDCRAEYEAAVAAEEAGQLGPGYVPDTFRAGLRRFERAGGAGRGTTVSRRRRHDRQDRTAVADVLVNV
ncbi:hypothetical protein GCM10022384_55890 [Streptomyces marokkonensis]|uniref:Uncharacterized protein n=1 Tax=Streptomyces marokkonensis TaxID=324855 RepID=A0ABP7RTD6_9ACTN